MDEVIVQQRMPNGDWNWVEDLSKKEPAPAALVTPPNLQTLTPAELEKLIEEAHTALRGQYSPSA